MKGFQFLYLELVGFLQGFDKLFFLSPIDSCLVSFFCSCEQSLSSCEVRLATSCGARRHFGLWAWGQEQVGGGRHWHVQGPFTWTSFGFVSWTQHVACLSSLTLWMCLLLGSVFFKKVWDKAYVVVTLPHYCLTLDFNPLFHYLEQYLFMFVWTEAHCLQCDELPLSASAFIWTSTSSEGRSCWKFMQHSTCFLTFANSKMFQLSPLFLWFIHVIHCSPGRSVKGAEWWSGTLPWMCRRGACLALLAQTIPLHGQVIHVRGQEPQAAGLHLIGRGHHVALHLLFICPSIRWLLWTTSHVIKGTTIMCSVQSCVLTQIVSMWRVTACGLYFVFVSFVILKF